MHYFISDKAAIAFVTASHASYADVTIDDYMAGIVEDDLAEEEEDYSLLPAGLPAG